MHQLALLVIQICLEFHISLEVKWIPWELNAKADVISNLTDYDDYTINEATRHKTIKICFDLSCKKLSIHE